MYPISCMTLGVAWVTVHLFPLRFAFWSVSFWWKQFFCRYCSIFIKGSPHSADLGPTLSLGGKFAYLILTVLTFWFNSLKDNLFAMFPSSWGAYHCYLPTYGQEHSHAHGCSRDAGQQKQHQKILKECCFETRCVGSSKNRSQTENIQHSQRGRVRNKHLRHPFSPLHWCGPDRWWPSILNLSGFLINSPLVSAFIIYNDNCTLSLGSF